MSDFNLMLPEEEKALKLARAGVDAATISEIQQERAAMELVGDLTPEEVEYVNEFAEGINLHDSTLATDYALSSQRELGTLTDKALKGVTGKDIGDIGEMLANMAVAMQDFNGEFNSEMSKTKKRFFSKAKKNLAETKARMQVRYTDVLDTLCKIAKVLDGRCDDLKKDSAMLDKLYNSILDYYKQLHMYIMAAKKALQDTVDGELAELQRIYDETKTNKAAENFQKCQEDCNAFEKRIFDLELTREICLQTAPQIRIIQKTNTDSMQKIISTINNSIPLWKQSISTNLALTRSEQAVESFKTMRSLTSDMLVRNAELLNMVGTESAKVAEEGYINPEAIMESNKLLINTINSMAEIHRNGLEKRNSVRKAMADGELELAAALSQPYTKDLKDWVVA